MKINDLTPTPTIVEAVNKSADLNEALDKLADLILRYYSGKDGASHRFRVPGFGYYTLNGFTKWLRIHRGFSKWTHSTVYTALSTKLANEWGCRIGRPYTHSPTRKLIKMAKVIRMAEAADNDGTQIRLPANTILDMKADDGGILITVPHGTPIAIEAL